MPVMAFLISFRVFSTSLACLVFLSARVRTSCAITLKPAPAAPKPQPKKAARPKSVEPKPSRDEMTFAQRMVTSKEPTGENEIPGMAPAQKIIIVLALIAFIVFMVYTITGSMGLH